MQFLKLCALLWFSITVQAFSPVMTETSVKQPAPMEDLQYLTTTSVRKEPGSGRYQKAWIVWSNLAIQHIRYDLSQNLPHPVDAESTEQLEFQLGSAADNGLMPSFADPGSRSGYALDFFSCRVRRLSDMIMFNCQQEVNLVKALIDALREPGECHVTSIAGGPGYDYVGLCLVAAFLNNGKESGSCIRGTVFDYEVGWGDLVDCMDQSTNRIMQQLNNEGLSCTFGGGCDITKSMDDPVNHACRDSIDSTKIFVCQYCVAENAVRLRESDYVFFRDLFDHANDGSLFVLTECTHRLWPAIVDLLGGGGFEVAFVKNRSWQLLIQKRHGADISPEVRARCASMREDDKLHTVKVKGGFVRQSKKIRAAR